MAEIGDIAALIRPDGSLTDKGQALNDSSQKWLVAVYAEARAALPVPKVPKVPADSPDGPSQPPEPPPAPLWMDRIMNAPESETEWLVDGMLPAGGMSLLVAAPKVGKTTFARVLGLAVARGMEFLDRDVARGTVLMLSLEDSERKFRSHMREIGATEDDPIGLYGPGVFTGQSGKRLDLLEKAIREFSPVLVVIDPLFKFVSIRDSDAYAEVSAALDPLMQIARATGAHLLLTHHARKSGGEDGSEVLGSQALFGGVDTLISVKRDGDGRTIQTTQRDGDDLPESLLRMTPDAWLELGSTKADMRRREIDGEILGVLETAPDTMTADAIRDAIGRRKDAVLSAVRRLTKDGAVVQIREGRTYRYRPPGPPR